MMTYDIEGSTSGRHVGFAGRQASELVGQLFGCELPWDIIDSESTFDTLCAFDAHSSGPKDRRARRREYVDTAREINDGDDRRRIPASPKYPHGGASSKRSRAYTAQRPRGSFQAPENIGAAEAGLPASIVRFQCLSLRAGLGRLSRRGTKDSFSRESGDGSQLPQLHPAPALKPDTWLQSLKETCHRRSSNARTSHAGSLSNAPLCPSLAIADADMRPGARVVITQAATVEATLRVLASTPFQTRAQSDARAPALPTASPRPKGIFQRLTWHGSATRRSGSFRGDNSRASEPSGRRLRASAAGDAPPRRPDDPAVEDDAPAVLSALSRMPDDLLGVIALRSVSNVVAWPGMTAEELQGVVSCRAVSSVDLAGRTVRGRNVRVDRPGVSIRNGALLLSGSPVRVEHLAPGGDRGASIGSAEEDEDEEGPNEPAEAAAERNVLSDTEQSDGSTGAPGEGVDGSDTARVLASDAPPADGVERAEGGSGSGGAGGGFDGVVDLIHGLGGNEDGEESGPSPGTAEVTPSEDRPSSAVGPPARPRRTPKPVVSSIPVGVHVTAPGVVLSAVRVQVLDGIAVLIDSASYCARCGEPKSLHRGRESATEAPAGGVQGGKSARDRDQAAGSAAVKWEEDEEDGEATWHGVRCCGVETGDAACDGGGDGGMRGRAEIALPGELKPRGPAVVLTRCSLDGASNSCLRASGKGTKVRLHQCVLGKSSGRGVVVRSGAQVLVTETSLASCGKAAVDVHGSETTVGLQRCEMTSCETGVQISGKGKCALDSVFIDASRGLGLSVVGEGSVLQGAHVRVNGSYRHGLEIGGHASADLSSCTLSKSGSSAIVLHTGGVARVSDTVLSSNRGAAGVLVLAGSRVTMAHCEIANSEGCGVRAKHQGTQATLLRCRILNAKTRGAKVSDGAALRMEGCTIWRTALGHGIAVAGVDTTADIEACAISHVRCCGISVEGGGHASAWGCTIDGAVMSGASAVGLGTRLKMVDCAVEGAAESGVSARERCVVLARGVKVRACKDFGVLAAEGAFVHARTSMFSSSKHGGARVSRGAKMDAAQCVFADNSGPGVGAEGDGSRAALEGCGVVGNGTGVSASEKAAVTVLNCQVERCAGAGIAAADCARVVASDTSLRACKEGLAADRRASIAVERCGVAACPKAAVRASHGATCDVVASELGAEGPVGVSVCGGGRVNAWGSIVGGIKSAFVARGRGSVFQHVSGEMRGGKGAIKDAFALALVGHTVLMSDAQRKSLSTLKLIRDPASLPEEPPSELEGGVGQAGTFMVDNDAEDALDWRVE